MTLYEKIQETEAGRHACDIGAVLYNHETKIGKPDADRLSAAQAYLEKLAIAELKAQLESWQRELLERKAIR